MNAESKSWTLLILEKRHDPGPACEGGGIKHPSDYLRRGKEKKGGERRLRSPKHQQKGRNKILPFRRGKEGGGKSSNLLHRGKRKRNTLRPARENGRNLVSKIRKKKGRSFWEGKALSMGKVSFRGGGTGVNSQKGESFLRGREGIPSVLVREMRP